MILRRTLGLVLLALSAGCPMTVDPGPTPNEIAAAATANCEASTDALKATGQNMLPGRVCGNCHRAGGQSARFPWTVSGTVYGSASASCNTGGLAGAKVEILNGAGTTVQLTLTTNSVGNFFTNMPVTFPIRARISKDGKTQEMFGMQQTGACASCHQNPGVAGAPGRIYLN